MKRKLLCILSGIFCIAAVFAQSGKTGFFELKDASLFQPRFIGKIDDFYLLMDSPEPQGTPLYCFDSSFRLVIKTYLSVAAYHGDVYAAQHTARLSWLNASDGYIAQKQLAIVDGSLQIQDKSVSFKQSFRSYYSLREETDKNNQFQFFYSLQAMAADTAFIKGVLLDKEGNQVKEIQTLFKWRRELEQDPKVLVDVKGNIHIVTLDHLNSYRISTEVVINTIPLQGQALFTASYPLHKVKFDNFLLSDNIKQQKIQLQGIYYDGQNKIKAGIACVQFEYDRSVWVHSRLTPMEDSLKKEMRRGMPHIRKKDNVLNSIYHKDIVEKDGYVLVTARVKDISEREVKRDREWEVMQSKTAQSLRRSANGSNAMISNPEQLNQWLSDAQRLNTTIIRPPVADIRTPGVATQELPAFSNLSPPDFGSAPLYSPSANLQNLFSYTAQRRQPYKNRTEKLVYWIVDDSGYCKKYGIIDDHAFQAKDSVVLQLLSYPQLQDKNYLYFSGLHPVSSSGALYPVLRLEKRDHENWLFPVNYKNDTVLYLPFTNENGQYAGLSKNNKTGKYGITFIQPE